MNILAIALADRSSDDGEDYTGIQIFIDGVDLHSMIRDFELPMAKREHAERIAGDYFALDAATVDRAYFLGDAVREYGIPLDQGCFRRPVHSSPFFLSSLFLSVLRNHTSA